jgi:hypothetical protein
MLPKLSVLSSGVSFDNSNSNYDNSNTNVSVRLYYFRSINLANRAKNNKSKKSVGTLRLRSGENDLSKVKA